MRQRGFTLIEMLVTISLIAMFICVAIPYFTHSAKTTKRFATDAFSPSDIGIIKDEFRSFVHTFKQNSFSISSDGRSVCSTDGKTIELKDASIVFLEPSGKKKELRLAETLEAALSVEKLPSGTKAAVLTLVFAPEQTGGRQKKEFKILAAPPADGEVPNANHLLENYVPN